jgi:hypothetical protein
MRQSTKEAAIIKAIDGSFDLAGPVFQIDVRIFDGARQQM